VSPKVTDEGPPFLNINESVTDRVKMKRELTVFSQELRKSMTKEERHLWYDFFKKLDVTVKRQYVFGGYIVDFYISCAKLAIEIDGSQHYSSEGAEKDRIRDRYFQKHGITVLRYSNREILQEFDNVCADILAHIKIKYN
jgi:very-short-patch-repair endonuclease